MENGTFEIGQLVSKMCLGCGEEQSHKIATLTKRGQISKVICSVCGVASTFKSGSKAAVADDSPKTGTPYDRTRTYRKGQTMMHDAFGYGEVMSVVEPRKIDVKFSDRLRRLIHAQN
jgi:hypothetical protein